MSRDTINGIPRLDLHTRPVWKRKAAWWMGGPLFASKRGLALWRKFAAPIEAPLMKATRGRVKLSFTLPVVVLTSVGARSGERREIPLAYFTDGDDVILIASNFGRAYHPAWYLNLKANPDVVVTYKGQTKPYLAREAQGEERNLCWQKALDCYPGYDLYQKRAGSRRIPVVLLDPA